MVVYSCPKCQQIFERKSTYINHVEKRKTSCSKNTNNMIINPPKLHQDDYTDPPKLHQNIKNIHQYNADVIDDNNNNNNNNYINMIVNDDIIIITKYKCESCKKYFSRSDVLKKHLGRCKVHKEENKEKEEIYKMLLTQQTQINTLINENSKLNDLVVKLAENNTHTLTNAHNTTTDSNNTNNTNNTTNTNNGSIATNNGTMATNNGNITTNNIKIEFGKEDLDKISNDFFIKTLLNFSGAAIPSKIIEGIHFNPELKEFMNVFITDMSRNKAMIHDGNKWNIANADEVVDTLFDRAVNFCEDRNEELKEKIEKNDKINKKINKEMYIIDIMTNNEPYEYDEHNQPINIDGKVLKIDELKRGKRLNIKAKEHLKKNLYNKKEVIQKIK